MQAKHQFREDFDWCRVEFARLNRIVNDSVNMQIELRHQNEQLHQQLALAQSGLELADLIRRIAK